MDNGTREAKAESGKARKRETKKDQETMDNETIRPRDGGQSGPGRAGKKLARFFHSEWSDLVGFSRIIDLRFTIEAAQMCHANRRQGARWEGGSATLAQMRPLVQLRCRRPAGWLAQSCGQYATGSSGVSVTQ